jgi:hypothetical protein
MYDNEQKHPDHDCPHTDEPATQPHPPGSDETCKDKPLPETEPPEWKDPPLCLPDSDCECPTDPTSDPNCLEDLITAKAIELAQAEKTKASKADLESLLTKANAATQDYTRATYDGLIKEWVKQDEAIANQIRNFVCGLPCWRCAIECYICPLLHKMKQAEQKLYWDPASYPYPEAKNLYDRLYWYTRDKEAKERTFNRIKSVLAAWEKPAQTIAKVLADNAKLIADIDKAPGSDSSKVLFDLFLRLVPRHLAIAPPSNSTWKTKIDKKFTVLCKCDEKLCKCDKPNPDDCCGPDVGEWSLLQRFIGPLPYLIDPKDYITVICCLVKTRYKPAEEALGLVEGKVLEVETDIKQAKDSIENGLKDFEKNAKGKLPTIIECYGKQLPHPTKDTSEAS